MLRRRFDWLRSLSDDELRRISICEEGDTLHEDEEYFDLSHPEQGIIRGREVRTVPKGSCFVAHRAVSPATWQRLTGWFSGGTHLGTI